MKFAFGVMVNDIQRLDMVFGKSKIDPSIPAHSIKMPDSATKGLNTLLDIIDEEGADVAILTHQDMYYRHDWLAAVEAQLNLLPEDWVVAGVIGKCMKGVIAGKFHDMRIPDHFDTSDVHIFPQPACCFDECCIIVNMKKGLRFDEGLDGFDLYGTLCVLQAWEMGGTAWIIDAYAEHYCMRPFTWIPDSTFQRNFKWVHEKYKHLKRIDSTAIGVPQEAMRFETSA